MMTTPSECHIPGNMASGRPITELPDDLLYEIFSYITSIPEKMSLEQVCRHFQSIASHSESWKGIHKLEMMIMCRVEGYHTGVLKGTCPDGVFLNGIGVPFSKWPAAIQLLLDRTTIKQVMFHCGDSQVVKSDPMSSLLETFHQNLHKMKLKFLEFHFHPQIVSFCPQELIVQHLHAIFSELLQISTPHLQEFVLRVERAGDWPHQVERKGSFPEIWPIVQKCKSLKSISFDCPELSVDLKSLIGKPLTKLEICQASNEWDREYKNVDMETSIEIINSRKGGVQSIDLMGLYLAYTNPLPFRYFCHHLNKEARDQLKLIKVDLQDFEMEFEMVPSIFPNLTNIEITFKLTPGIEIAQFCAMVVSYFSVAESESSNCNMRVAECVIDQDGEMFDDWRTNLSQTCQNQAIDVQFGQPPNQVHLTKGNAAIVIGWVNFGW